MPEFYRPSPANPGRILAVDDLPGNLKVLAAELKEHPFLLTFARTGEEALSFCETQAFEGILMDVSLEGMDGLEACRKIHETPLNRRTPLIFVSAIRIGTDWITEGIAAGGLDYLIKPYALPELLAKLGMLVRLSRQDAAALAGERHRALLEIAGGTAHELAQPLARAQLLVDQLSRADQPDPEQLKALKEVLEQTCHILRQVQNLHTYITRPYAQGAILDLALSSQIADRPASN